MLMQGLPSDGPRAFLSVKKSKGKRQAGKGSGGEEKRLRP